MRPSTMTHCRACGSDRMFLFLPMGRHPPANMFVRPEDVDQPQSALALNTQTCLDNGMIEEADQIPEGFVRHDLHILPDAATMHGHFEGLAAVLTERAAKNGVQVHVACFDPETADEVRALHGPAQVISTTTTLEHIGDLVGRMDGINGSLADDGWFVIDIRRGREIPATRQFDDVYHEHLSEMRPHSLADRTGMAVVDVIRLPVHGGSVRVFIRKPTSAAPPSPEIIRTPAEEDGAAFKALAARAHAVGDALRGLLAGLKAEAARIAGRGAPAKGNTLPNFFDLGTGTQDYRVDRNPLEQGFLSPGKRLPIHDPAVIADNPPDSLLVLARTFFDGFRTQLAGDGVAGGRPILPLPYPRIVI
ncbi:class I SAM-dependent methyltransferase [Paracoccus sp. S1E-3]|uniref:class I SAM-dependent methyltransferase n=1 Tax=Paracoccus sp. S1E-3 TaxID=2756130 RepID=UPI0015EF0E04|nr:class I SAM-dependent methyltransferase [Paracoccus sp. S1E-3]MBA4490905.1 methyltransferase domain-containing protein [Paracoccus sp. S1E-3]